MSNTVIVPGSFDPPTNGHVNLVHRAAGLFDHIIVLVAVNSSKKNLFSAEERVEMLKEIFKNLDNVEVDFYNGLIAVYAKQKGINTLVRGIRNAADYSYETEIFQVNKTVSPDLETIFIPSLTQFENIRSSSIRELAFYNQDVSLFVPEIVNKYLTRK